MSASKHVLGSDLSKIDAHIIQPDEYQEIPELSDEFFEQADLHIGGKLIQTTKFAGGVKSSFKQLN